MIVPLLSGSGMRVKILEGMALGKVVISTSIGEEGIHAKHRESFILADSKEEFLESIAWLSENRSQLTIIGKNARQFITEEFDEDKNAKRLLKFYSTLT